MLISQLLEQVLAQRTYQDADTLARQLSGQMLDRDPQEILALAPAVATRLAFLLSDRIHFASRSRSHADLQAIWASRTLLRTLLSRLLRRKLPYQEQDFLAILEAFGELGRDGYWGIPGPMLLTQIERFVAAHGLSEKMRRALSQFRTGMRGDYAKMRKLKQRVSDILGVSPGELVEPGEPWADALLADLTDMQPDHRPSWDALLRHAVDLQRPVPALRWIQTAKERLAAVGHENFGLKLLGWLDRLEHPASGAMPEKAADLLRGLVWLAVDLPGPEVSHALGEVALACYRKIPGIGARSRKVGNACLQALASRSDVESVSALVRIQQKVRYVEAQRLVAAAMEKAAANAGLAVEELEELAVPRFGLDSPAGLVETFGDTCAEIAIQRGGRARLIWKNARGKLVKSVPAMIRRDHKEDLKRLRKTTKEINAALTVQRLRLERLMVRQPTWPVAVWRLRYMEQPLVAVLARSLIWRFRHGSAETLGIWHQGALRDRDGHPIQGLDDASEVSLWHPLGYPVEEILAWRLWLEAQHVTQPFKQAHREIYLLTDAERETADYSNRFAAHILRQHQFAALCRERGWRYSLQGAWDGHNTPTISLPHWNLKAEFWVDAIPEGAFPAGGGIYPYVTTDQVRFYEGTGQRLALESVPPLLFSEILRDVDLFVGVCSVGNDADWQDRGEEGVYGRYWREYSFGDLSVTAQTRKEVLERLLPRLKIGSRCSVEGKFLVVHGNLRTYRIHLGSGNILMEPGAQYLCVVPGRRTSSGGATPDLFLPFDGDGMLSVILSKAVLLADDQKITDPSIVSQIRRR